MQRRNFLSGLAAIIAASQAPFVRASASTVRIGVSLPLTGANAAFGLDARSGIEAYLATRRQSAPLVVSIADDANVPANALENTKRMIANGANVMFGYASATITKPCQPLCADQSIPIYAPFSGAKTLRTNPGPLLLTVRASYEQEAAKFAERFKQIGVTRVTVVHYEDVVGLENYSVCREALERQAIRVERTSILRNQSVGDDVTTAIVATQPEVVLFTTLATPTATLIRAVRANQKMSTTFFATLSFVGPSQLQAMMGNQSRGIIVSHVVPAPWEIGIPVVRAYLGALRAAQSKRDPSFTGLEAYLALSALEQGLQHQPIARPLQIGQAMTRARVSVHGFALDFAEGRGHPGNFVDQTIIRGATYAT